MIAPFILGFAEATAVWANVILGVIVAVVAAYQVFFVKPPQTHGMREMKS